MNDIYTKSEIIKIIDENRCKNGRINGSLIIQFRLGKFQELYNSLLFYTNFLAKGSGISERIYCIKNKIIKTPNCDNPNCSNFVKWNRSKREYGECCSYACANIRKNKERIITEKTREKLRKQALGNKRQEKRRSEKTKRKIGEANKISLLGISLPEKTRKRMSKIRKGKTYNEIFGEKKAKKLKRDRRLIAIKRIKENKGNMFPVFNKKSIEYFERFDKENNTQGLYGKNEFQIKELGYWIDYINFELKLIIEWDEEPHYENNQLRIKDIQRQKEIERYYPDFKFRRIREKIYGRKKRIA